MSKIIKSATLLTGFAGVGLVTASAEETTVVKSDPYSSLEITRSNKEFQLNQLIGQEIPTDSQWAGTKEREYTNPEDKKLLGKKDFTVTPSSTGGTVKYRVTTVGSKADTDDESAFITQITNKTTNTFESLNMFGRDENGRLHSNRSEEITLGAGDYEFTYYYNGTGKTPAQVKLEQFDETTNQYTTIHEETKDLRPVKETYMERTTKETKKRIAEVGAYSVQSKNEQTTPHKVKYESDDTREAGVKEKVQDGVDKRVEVTNVTGIRQYAKGILRFNVERERKTLEEFRKDPEVKANILGVVDLRNMNEQRLNKLADDLETLKGTHINSEHTVGDNVRLAFYGNDNEPPLRVSYTDTMSHQQFDTLVENLRTYKGDYSPQSIIDQIFGNGLIGDSDEGVNPNRSIVEKFKRGLVTGPKAVTGVVYFSSDDEIKQEVKDFVEAEGKMLYHVSYKKGYKQYWDTDKIHTLKEDINTVANPRRRAIMRTDINAYLYGEKPQLRFNVNASSGTIEYVKYRDANGQEHNLSVDRYGNASQSFTLPNSIEGIAEVEYKIDAGNSTSYFDATVSAGNRDLARQADQIGSGDLPQPKVLEAGRDEIWKVGTKPKVVEEEINYETETELDPNKPDTYSVVKTPGKKGKKITTTTYSVDETTGNVTSSENVTTEESVKEVIVKGAKKTKKVESPKEYKPDPELEGGQTRVIQEGTPDTIDEDGKVIEKGKPRIVQVGTKPKVVETEIDFNVVNEEDPTKPVGTKVVKQVGKKGKRTTTTNYTVNEKTGEVVATDTVVDEVPVDEINVIGTGANQLVELPTEYREDPELDGGQVEEIQKGVPELRDVTGKVLTEGKPRIVKVGTKPKVTKEEDIDFNVVNEEDTTKPVGSKEVKQVGKKGKRTTTTHYTLNKQTGEVTTEDKVTEEKPVDEINVIGVGENKLVELPTEYREDPDFEGGKIEELQKGDPEIRDVTGKVVKAGTPRIVKVGTKSKVVEKEVDFNVVNEKDATKPTGTKEVKQVGKKGKVVTTTTYKVNKDTGEVISEDKVTEEKPIDEINVIGTGQNKLVELPTEYIEDRDLDGGKTEEVQKGEPEVRDVTGKVLTQGKPRIVKVGTKSKVTKEEDIDFEVITNKDKTKPVGTEEVTQKGVKGKRTTTTTYTLNKQTGEVTTKDDVTEVKPINEIRTIGSGENKVYDIVTKYIADPLLTGSRVVEVQEGKPEIVDVNGRIVQKGEPRIVKIGTRPRVMSEDIDFKVVNEEDGAKPVGYKELKQKGVKGKRTVTVNYKVDKTNGKITTEETTKVDEPINEIYTIGVGQNKLTELPTEYIEDPNMDGGKVEEVSKGRPEIKDPSGRVIDKGEARKVKVGTKPKVTKEEDIDFKVINQEDKTRPVGENTVVQKGVKGKKTTTTVYTLDKTTGKVTTEDKVTVQEPVDEIHRIGTGANISRDLPVEYIEDNTLEGGKLEEISKGRPEVKDVTGKVLDKGEPRKVRVGTKSTTKDTVEIPYKVIDKEDATLPVGQTKVSIKGVNGKRITHVDYKFNKETGKFETKERVEEIKPTDEVRLVGTKPVEKPVVQKPAVEKPKAKQLPETGSRELGIFGIIGLALAGMLGLRRKENK